MRLFAAFLALLLLGASGVRIIGKQVPAAWWTPAASQDLRAHLSSSLELSTT